MKAQVAIEFITFVGIIMIILTVATFSALSASRDIVADNEVASARSLASVVAQEVNTAAEIGSGYSHKFSLPELMYGGANYSVNFTEYKFVYVIWNDKSYSLPVLANATGTVKKGLVTISNVNGVITFG